MASIQELKNIIVELRMNIVNLNVPYGHCPYAYYSTSKQQDRENCNDIGCDECRRKFLEDMREDISKDVEQW